MADPDRLDTLIAEPRERLRRACEDGERLYRVRMHSGNGETIKDGNRIDGLLTLDLPDALGAFDRLAAALVAEREARSRAEEIIAGLDEPYPIEVFPERTDEQRDAIFAAMRAVDPYATEWFYAHVARDRARVAREALAGVEEATK